jgi:hypothetical protein
VLTLRTENLNVRLLCVCVCVCVWVGGCAVDHGGVPCNGVGGGGVVLTCTEGWWGLVGYAWGMYGVCMGGGV